MPKPTSDNCRLLHGPYRTPPLRIGARATCLYRDRDVIVTSWTDAPIIWPRGVPVGGSGHPSLVVDDELTRAVRNEAARAVCFWWRVGEAVVWRWRRQRLKSA